MVQTSCVERIDKGRLCRILTDQVRGVSRVGRTIKALWLGGLFITHERGLSGIAMV
jgi:hypothetical protein|tara:strand:- start:794 stop:961 length:168 start_codon:yes stop_codon:yes gene_type:complete